MRYNLSAYKVDTMEIAFDSKQIPKNLKYSAIEFHDRRNSTAAGSKPEVFATWVLFGHDFASIMERSSPHFFWPPVLRFERWLCLSTARSVSSLSCDWNTQGPWLELAMKVQFCHMVTIRVYVVLMKGSAWRGCISAKIMYYCIRLAPHLKIFCPQ